MGIKRYLSGCLSTLWHQWSASMR